MESGFSSLAQVAVTLFGLVLVSFVFAYTTAIAKIDSIGDFSHFASWIWAAGFSCFLYFTCCFLISFRLIEDETWVPAIAGIVIPHTTLTYKTGLLIFCFIGESILSSGISADREAVEA